MKLLLAILSVLIAVNGNSVEPNNSLSEADLKEMCEELLKKLMSIKEELQQIQNDASYAINLKLGANAEYRKHRRQHIKGLIEKSMTSDCNVKSYGYYVQTLETIASGILNKTLKSIISDENNLNTIQKEMNFLPATLEQNLDQEVQNCVNDSKACSTTGKFTQGIEKLFTSIDLIKQKVMNDVQNQISAEDLQNIVNALVANLPKCATSIVY